MARIKHIALTTKEPAKVAEFYKSAFGLKELRRSPNGAVFLTDGHINVAILNYKTDASPDVGAHGPNFDGIHHFGFEVDDLDEACQKLENANAQRLTAKDHVDATMAAGGHANFEMKWAGPDGVVINAVVDALSECGVTHIEMPATPERVWRAINGISNDTPRHQ